MCNFHSILRHINPLEKTSTKSRGFDSHGGQAVSQLARCGHLRVTSAKDQEHHRHKTFEYFAGVMAMSHGAIFVATGNAILQLRDVNLVNTRLHHILLMYSSHIKKSSL